MGVIKIITGVLGYFSRNVAGLLGVVEAIFDLVEQGFIVVLRILTLLPGDKGDILVAAWHEKYQDIRDATLARAKDFFIKLGGLDV